MILKSTMSFCPTCYKRIPADIYVEGGSVYMRKYCSEHGQTVAMVERDVDFYYKVSGGKGIYNGYFIDVTERCNIKCEYCSPAGSLILMGDLTYKKIEDVVAGDSVVGFSDKNGNDGLHKKYCASTVLSVGNRIAECVEIATTSGHRVKCSEDHKWFFGRNYTTAAVGKSLRVASVPTFAATEPTEDFKIGYIHGAFDGDGHVKERTNTGGDGGLCRAFSIRFTAKDSVFVQRVKTFADDLGIFFTEFKFKNISGEAYDAIRSTRKSTFAALQQRALENESDDYKRGWLSGVYDAEGSVDSETKVLSISQVGGCVLNKIVYCLRYFGIKFSFYRTGKIEKSGPRGNLVCYILRVTSNSMRVKFLSITNTCIPRKRDVIEGRGIWGKEEIVSIVGIGEMRVYGLQTSTGNYVVNGCLSKNCYRGPTNKKDPSIERLMQEAVMAKGYGQFIVTGGEPTLRDDLPQILEQLNCISPGNALLTNGIKMDEGLLDAVVPHLRHWDGTVGLNLSMHPESNGADMKLIKLMRAKGLKLESILWVINDLSQIADVVDFAEANKDVIAAVRLKVATKLWAEQKPENKIFVSDMLKYLKDNLYNPEVIWWLNNRVTFFNVSVSGIHFMLVSWYDVNNIDILDYNSPPVYKSKIGLVENLVTSCIVNEGISKGWIDGVQIKCL